MSPSADTGSLVLAKAGSATNRLKGHVPLPPGCAAGGCTIPGLWGCIIAGGSVRVDAMSRSLTLKWAPPLGQSSRFSPGLHLQER